MCIPLFKERYSGYSFDKNKTVPLFFIERCFKCGRWAPSCYGDEPWRYIICHRGNKDGAYDKVLSLLAKPNQKWAKRCPPSLLFLWPTIFFINRKAQPLGWLRYRRLCCLFMPSGCGQRLNGSSNGGALTGPILFCILACQMNVFLWP
ncbi:MAG: nitroreductase family protein [Holosporaceae bacterium]|nr:MAG: nitroreductase family protein [Holosporaceae bacterium]